MVIFKFRIHMEDQDLTVYRDVEIIPTQTIYELHLAILEAYSFNNLFEAEFYESDEDWYTYKSYPISTNLTDSANQIRIKDIVKSPHQHLVYVYDPDKVWNFNIELIQIYPRVEESSNYPKCVKKIGIAPAQYTPAELAEMGNSKNQLNILKIKSSIR